MRNFCVAALLLAVLAGCKQTEKTEAVVSEIEAAQIDGRNTAKRMLGIDWTDSVTAAAAYHEVDSLSHQYVDTTARRIFRETFRSTIETVNGKR